MTTRIDALIRRHDLQPHPEGGFYREVHRSPVRIPGEHLPPGPMGPYPGDRTALTAIHFLLPAGTPNAVHRVRSEELWILLEGDPLVLMLRRDPAEPPALSHELSTDGMRHAVVPPGGWQNVAVAAGPHGYALAMCLVAPGFDFEDFEMVAG
ncbi:MAG: cupin domain-containing protein [Planctomycetota bacterium]|jgi:predicted cupin superfamily sugar epimerase